MVRANEPHKTSETPARERSGDRPHEEHAPEWRGGDRPEQEETQRSGDRGWGRPNAGGQRQQGDGGQRAGDLDNQEMGGRDEKGDQRRFEQSEKSEAGQGRSNQ